MRWTEPQRAMLREMGLRLWGPDSAAPVSAGPATAEPTRQAVPAAPYPAPVPARPTVAREATPPAMAPPAQPSLPSSPSPAAPPTRPEPIATPRAPSPVDGMDWPALREAVAGCRACGLCESRHHTVFGVGHAHAPLMVVGEAPGEQEDLRGEPFVGAAGQLLDRMLAALGLSRDATAPGHQVFIANALKCRPPRNRNPSPEELATCQPFLERQVALVQPRVILAMGRFAVQSLLGSDAPIGKLRGQVHRWRGVPLVVTYHPAYLLRQPTDKARAWDDLCRAAELLSPSST